MMIDMSSLADEIIYEQMMKANLPPQGMVMTDFRDHMVCILRNPMGNPVAFGFNETDVWKTYCANSLEMYVQCQREGYKTETVSVRLNHKGFRDFRNADE
jgi:hypothetical protein